MINQILTLGILVGYSVDLNLGAGKYCQSRFVVQSINSQYLHILPINAHMSHLQNCKNYIGLYQLSSFCANAYLKKVCYAPACIENPCCFIYGYFSRKTVNCSPINVTL